VTWIRFIAPSSAVCNRGSVGVISAEGRTCTDVGAGDASLA
jgi:hypothetical protein